MALGRDPRDLDPCGLLLRRLSGRFLTRKLDSCRFLACRLLPQRRLPIDLLSHGCEPRCLHALGYQPRCLHPLELLPLGVGPRNGLAQRQLPTDLLALSLQPRSFNTRCGLTGGFLSCRFQLRCPVLRCPLLRYPLSRYPLLRRAFFCRPPLRVLPGLLKLRQFNGAIARSVTSVLRR